MDSDWIYGIIFAIVILLIVFLIIIFIPSSKIFLAILAPVLMGLGIAARDSGGDDDIITCKHCCHELDDDAQSCSNCGKRVNDNCRNCGHKLDDGAEFCPVCGTRFLDYGHSSTDINDVIRNIENKKCRNCGRRLEDNEKFCPICGTRRIYK